MKLYHVNKHNLTEWPGKLSPAMIIAHALHAPPGELEVVLASDAEAEMARLQREAYKAGVKDGSPYPDDTNVTHFADAEALRLYPDPKKPQEKKRDETTKS